MSRFAKLAFYGCIMVYLLASSGVAISADKPITIKFGQSMPPDTYLDHGARAFKNICEKESQGRLQVEVYTMGQIGSERVMFESVQMGSVDGVLITQGPIPGFYNDFMVLEIPYLFSSYPVIYRFFKSELWKSIEADFLKKTGVRILIESESGFRHTTNSKRPIYSPDDFKGLKIRTMESPVIMETVRALGADPTAIAWGEVYTAMQQGVVDGHQNPVIVVRDAKLYEVQKYLTLDGSGYNSYFGHFNDKKLQSLPEDLRFIVIKAAKMAEMVLHGLQVTEYYKAIEDLQKKGMTICIPSPEQLDKFKKTTQEPVIKWLTTKGGVNKELVDKVLATVDKIEKDLKSGL